MLDLGITTYLFLFLNIGLLILSVTRLVVAFTFIFVSVYTYGSVRDITFSSLINESIYIGLNEMAMFILGILAGFKNNIRLMYTFEFLTVLLILTKGLSIRESVRDKDIIDEDLQLSLEDMMNDFRADPQSSPVRAQVTAIQSYFQCCGYESPDFYKEVDKSCCPEGKGECSKSVAYTDGCKGRLHVPNALFNVHYYTLFPVFEVILLIVGAVLIMFIKRTTRQTFG